MSNNIECPSVLTESSACCVRILCAEKQCRKCTEQSLERPGTHIHSLLRRGRSSIVVNARAAEEVGVDL